MGQRRVPAAVGPPGVDDHVRVELGPLGAGQGGPKLATIASLQDRGEDRGALPADTSKRLGVEARRFVVEEVDFLRDTARLTVYYRHRR